MIVCEHSVTAIKAAYDRLSHFAHRPAIMQTEESPSPFTMALNEAGFRQQFEMARNARLRLAQNGDELAHCEFGLAEQGEQANARDLTGRFKRGDQFERRDLCRCGLGHVWVLIRLGGSVFKI